MNGKFSLLQAVLSLLLPERCRVCGRPTARALCPDCLAAVAFCDDEAGGEGEDGEPPCRSLCVYSEPVSGLIHRLKYGGDRAVLPALAEIVAEIASRRGPAPHPHHDGGLIIPVPLHVSRLRSRGLNQSLLLARLFFPERRADIHSGLLIRQRPTSPQTGLSGVARRHNLRGAFAVSGDGGAILGRRVLLVDDVRTTGSTLAECGRVLMAHGAESVTCLTLARADLKPGSSSFRKKY